MKNIETAHIHLGIGCAVMAGSRIEGYLRDDFGLETTVSGLSDTEDNLGRVVDMASEADGLITYSYGVSLLRNDIGDKKFAIFMNGPEPEHIHVARTARAFTGIVIGHLVDTVFAEEDNRNFSRNLIRDNGRELLTRFRAHRRYAIEALGTSTLNLALDKFKVEETDMTIITSKRDEVTSHPEHYKDMVESKGMRYSEAQEAKHDTVLVYPDRVLTRGLMEEIFPSLQEDLTDSL